MTGKLLLIRKWQTKVDLFSNEDHRRDINSQIVNIGIRTLNHQYLLIGINLTKSTEQEIG
jgi:hypothetical protein